MKIKERSYLSPPEYRRLFWFSPSSCSRGNSAGAWRWPLPSSAEIKITWNCHSTHRAWCLTKHKDKLSLHSYTFRAWCLTKHKGKLSLHSYTFRVWCLTKHKDKLSLHSYTFRAWCLTKHKDKLSLHSYTFRAWCLTKHKDKLSLHSYKFRAWCLTKHKDKLSLHSFKIRAWCLTKHGDKFTFSSPPRSSEVQVLLYWNVCRRITISLQGADFKLSECVRMYGFPTCEGGASKNLVFHTILSNVYILWVPNITAQYTHRQGNTDIT